MSLPWYARLVLVRPQQIQDNLDRIRAAEIVERTPNPWQIFLGVVRMWNRILFHSGPIGTSDTAPMRDGWRPRLRIGWLQVDEVVGEDGLR